MDLAVALRDGVAVPLDHRGHLLALIGVDDENDLVMAQVESSLWVEGSCMAPRNEPRKSVAERRRF
jgi:hypothetical protein